MFLASAELAAVAAIEGNVVDETMMNDSFHEHPPSSSFFLSSSLSSSPSIALHRQASYCGRIQ